MPYYANRRGSIPGKKFSKDGGSSWAGRKKQSSKGGDVPKFARNGGPYVVNCLFSDRSKSKSGSEYLSLFFMSPLTGNISRVSLFSDSFDKLQNILKQTSYVVNVCKSFLKANGDMEHYVNDTMLIGNDVLPPPDYNDSDSVWKEWLYSNFATGDEDNVVIDFDRLQDYIAARNVFMRVSLTESNGTVRWIIVSPSRLRKGVDSKKEEEE